MATIRTCDRCGKHIMPHNEAWYYLTYTKKDHRELEDLSVCYDLCALCAYKFKKYMEGEENGDQTS